MAEKRVGSTFLTMFVPGLILGLIVGGLAGAFLAPVIESGSISDITKDVSKPLPAQTGPREDRPMVTKPAEGEVPATGDKPVEAPPADAPKDVKPEEKPAESPATTPPKQPG